MMSIFFKGPYKASLIFWGPMIFLLFFGYGPNLECGVESKEWASIELIYELKR